MELQKEEIQGELKDTEITQVHLTSRKQLLVVSDGYIIKQLKVYDAATGKHLSDIPEFGIGQHDRLVVAEDGKKVIAIRHNYELVKWDLDTGDATIVARLQPGFGTYGRRGDFVATTGSMGFFEFTMHEGASMMMRRMSLPRRKALPIQYGCFQLQRTIGT